MADIIHVITDMKVGGAGILLSHLLSPPSKRQGSLVVLPEGSLLCSLLREKDIPFVTLEGAKESSFSFCDVRAVGRILEERKPRLLVSHASLSARIAAKRLSIPALSVRHCDTPVFPFTAWLYNAVTDATVATSLPLGKHLRESGIKNVHVIENGYTAMGVPTVGMKRAARASLHIPEGKIAVGLVGRLSPVKGHETALRALALLGEKGKDFTLCFLGEGEEKERLTHLALALGIEKSVRFLGFSPDVRRFYHAIDAHISCSLGSETSSLSLAEGMSAGCPTLASDTEGNRARLARGGLLFPVGDAEALSALLLSLRDPKERRRLSRFARQRTDALPTWEEMKREYGRIFHAF
ncbi:MAG: glycosyltransferase [Ruminococcaceae bacterium]|nr:glycosyltransferase [Oscillospiraceae bacterium]